MLVVCLVWGGLIGVRLIAHVEGIASSIIEWQMAGMLARSNSNNKQLTHSTPRQHSSACAPTPTPHLRSALVWSFRKRNIGQLKRTFIILTVYTPKIAIRRIFMKREYLDYGL